MFKTNKQRKLNTIKSIFDELDKIDNNSRLVNKQITKKEKIVYDSNELYLEQQNNKYKPKIRKHNGLDELFNKKRINSDQLYVGEKLMIDYENSFINYKSSITLLGMSKTMKNSKIDSEKNIIQNINSYDRYHKAIMSINNYITREIIYEFCIANKSLTQLDKQLGNKRGEAETRLWYGLNELIKYYKIKKK